MRYPISVYYVVSTLRRCGPVRQLYYLIKFLDRTKFKPHIITLSDEPENSLKEYFLEMVEQITTLELTKSQVISPWNNKFSDLIAKLAPDLIHSQGIRADILVARLPDMFCRVCTQRNNPFEDYLMQYGRIAGIGLAYLHRWALKKIPNSVACSHTIAKRNVQLGVESHVILNGTDIPSFNSIKSDEEKQVARKSLGLPTNGPLFLFAGPLITRKSVDVLIRAFLSCPVSTPNRTLCILGDGPMMSELVRLADNNVQIIFAGDVGNTSQYYSVADVLVSASLSEGLPNSVLEGLAWGLPVLLSDIPSHRAILEHNKLIGSLFPPNDFLKLAESICEMQVSKCLKEAARSLAIENFSAELMSNKYQQLYELSLKPLDYNRK